MAMKFSKFVNTNSSLLKMFSICFYDIENTSHNICRVSIAESCAATMTWEEIKRIFFPSVRWKESGVSLISHATQCCQKAGSFQRRRGLSSVALSLFMVISTTRSFIIASKPRLLRFRREKAPRRLTLRATRNARNPRFELFYVSFVLPNFTRQRVSFPPPGFRFSPFTKSRIELNFS